MIDGNDMLYQMLNRIRKRPGQWLGAVDINKLKTYINGYHDALIDSCAFSFPQKTTLFPLNYWFMHEFSKIKTNSYNSSLGWANMILKECDNNHRTAMDRFFEYFDEFRSLRAVSMEKAILTKENILANDNMLYSYRTGERIDISHNDILHNYEQYFCCDNFVYRKLPIYDSPKAVYVIELSNNNGFLCAIETISDIKLIRYIFRKEEIIGDKHCHESPERVFGPITSFEKIPCKENPDFNKPIDSNS